MLHNEIASMNDRFQMREAPCLFEGADYNPRLQSGITPRASINYSPSIEKKNIIIFEKKFSLIKTKLHQKYPDPSLRFPEFQWHKSCHDHLIHNEHDLHRHIEYIWHNPVKHHVVQNSNNYCYVSSLNRFKDLIDQLYVSSKIA
jgi:hypothetical protein